ncbi:hypothetical protein J5751_02090 [bacterium]|nr:hypothetical protein [bacterium]
MYSILQELVATIVTQVFEQSSQLNVTEISGASEEPVMTKRTFCDRVLSQLYNTKLIVPDFKSFVGDKTSSILFDVSLYA